MAAGLLAGCTSAPSVPGPSQAASDPGAAASAPASAPDESDPSAVQPSALPTIFGTDTVPGIEKTPSWKADGRFVAAWPDHVITLDSSGHAIATAAADGHQLWALDFPAWQTQLLRVGDQLLAEWTDQATKKVTVQVVDHNTGALGEARTLTSGADAGFKQIGYDVVMVAEQDVVKHLALEPDGTFRTIGTYKYDPVLHSPDSRRTIPLAEATDGFNPDWPADPITDHGLRRLTSQVTLLWVTAKGATRYQLLTAGKAPVKAVGKSLLCEVPPMAEDDLKVWSADGTRFALGTVLADLKSETLTCITDTGKRDDWDEPVPLFPTLLGDDGTTFLTHSAFPGSIHQGMVRRDPDGNHTTQFTGLSPVAYAGKQALFEVDDKFTYSFRRLG